jgi:hypothetical protein
VLVDESKTLLRYGSTSPAGFVCGMAGSMNWGDPKPKRFGENYTLKAGAGFQSIGDALQTIRLDN